jgi:hypothetical protein
MRADAVADNVKEFRVMYNVLQKPLMVGCKTSIILRHDGNSLGGVSGVVSEPAGVIRRVCMRVDVTKHVRKIAAQTECAHECRHLVQNTVDRQFEFIHTNRKAVEGEDLHTGVPYELREASFHI